MGLGLSPTPVVDMSQLVGVGVRLKPDPGRCRSTSVLFLALGAVVACPSPYLFLLYNPFAL